MSKLFLKINIFIIVIYFPKIDQSEIDFIPDNYKIYLKENKK